MNTVVPLHALFVQKRNPESFICHDGHRYVNWQTFRNRVAGMANALKHRPERRWALFNEHTEYFALLLFALLHAGKHVVIPPNAQPKTLAQLSADVINAFDAIADESWLQHAPASTPLAPLNPTETIIDLYTSGSTGQPKLVRKNLTQFEKEVATLESLWEKSVDDTCMVATVPHHHIYGLLFRIFWPLSAGRTFDCVTCTYPDMLNDRLSFFKATTLISSPAQLSRLPALLPLDVMPFKPRMTFSSGGPLSSASASDIYRAWGAAPTEIFGSTETGGIAWRKQEKDSAWTVIPGITIEHDENDMPSLHSPFLSEETPFKMDDAVTFLEDGRFILGGRLDRIVKIEGKRLSLPEMEAHLLAHPWIEAASTLPLSGRRQTIGAALVLSPDGANNLRTSGRRSLIADLRAHLAQTFEAVLLPKQWRLIDMLPMTERGKVSANEIAALFVKDSQSNNAPVISPPKIFSPQVMHVERSTDSAHAVHLTLHVPKNLTHFEGHFPGLPILPGVVQIDWAVRYARHYLKIQGDFKSMENIRFQSLILPDAYVTLGLAWNPVRLCIEFSYTNDQRKFSSGRIVLRKAT